MSDEIPGLENSPGNSPVNPQVEEEFNRGDYDPTDSEIEEVTGEAEVILKVANGLNLESSELRSMIKVSELIANSRPEKLKNRTAHINQLEGVIKGVAVGSNIR